jgi:hypothetical protein
MPEVQDEVWRFESQKIASEICTKLFSCSKKLIANLPSKYQSFTTMELSSLRCIEKNKKSNIYFLRGNDPERIKTAYRNCNKSLIELNCEEITSGAISKIDDCKYSEQIQKGETP